MMKKSDLARAAQGVQPDPSLKERLAAGVVDPPERRWPRAVGITVATCMLVAMIVVSYSVWNAHNPAPGGGEPEALFLPGADGGEEPEAAEEPVETADAEEPTEAEKERIINRQYLDEQSVADLIREFEKIYGTGRVAVVLAPDERIPHTPQPPTVSDYHILKILSWKFARACLSNDTETIRSLMSSDAEVGATMDIFDNGLDYMGLKDIQQSGDTVMLSCEFLETGGDSFAYITIYMENIGGEWKVNSYGFEG